MAAFLAFLSMVSDTALWLGLGGLVLSLFVPVRDLSVLLPILGAASMAGYLLAQKKPGLRFLALAVLIPGGFLLNTIPNALLGVPALGYCLLAIWGNRLSPDRTRIYYQFGVVFGTAIVTAALCVLLKRDWCFLCCFLNLLLNLFLSRILRHQEAGTPRRLLAMETGLLGALCLTGLVLSRRAVLEAAWEAVKVVFRVVIAPIIMLLMYILEGIMWVLSFLFRGGVSEMPIMPMDSMMGSMQEEIPMVMEAEPDPFVQLLVRLVGAAFFLALGWVVLRFLKKGVDKFMDPEKDPEQKEETARLTGFESFTPISPLDRSPEASVRRAYAAYCRHLEKRRLWIEPYDTSRSVNVLADLEEDPDAVELRRLYLRARYTSHGALTREDARRAHQLVRAITKPKS